METFSATSTGQSRAPRKGSAPDGRRLTEQIAREYLEDIIRFAAYIGIDDHEIEDVAQETLLGVFESINKGAHLPDDVRAWVLGIARNQALKHKERRRYDRQKRRRAAELDAIPYEAQETDALSILARRGRLLHRLLEELHPDQRSVLVMYEILEMSMGQVAAAHGIPLATAYTRHRLGMEALEAAAHRWQARQRHAGLPDRPMFLPLLLDPARVEPVASVPRLDWIWSRFERALDVHARRAVGAGAAAWLGARGAKTAAALAGVAALAALPIISAVLKEPPKAALAAAVPLAELAPAPPDVTANGGAAVAAPSAPPAVPAPTQKPPAPVGRDHELAEASAALVPAQRALQRCASAEVQKRLGEHRQRYPGPRFESGRSAVLLKLAKLCPSTRANSR